MHKESQETEKTETEKIQNCGNVSKIWSRTDSMMVRSDLHVDQTGWCQTPCAYKKK